jgi:hypothetical protein
MKAVIDCNIEKRYENIINVDYEFVKNTVVGDFIEVNNGHEIINMKITARKFFTLSSTLTLYAEKI